MRGYTVEQELITMTEHPTDPNFGPFLPGEFDEWAEIYDESVNSDSFPFPGYEQVLKTVFHMAQSKEGDTILDLGTGTGNLARRFLELGCRVWGLDFSDEMLFKARLKFPQAAFGQADLRGEYPPEFQRRYDRIVSAYTFHHFPLSEKLALCQRLLDDFSIPDGSLIIADIAFTDAASQNEMRLSFGNEWEDEYYWLADETSSAFSAAGLRAEFTQVSSCAGVFQIRINDV
jgi:putative AdoMet-dependent methyltransferase